MVKQKTKDDWIRVAEGSGKDLPEHNVQVMFVDWVRETYPGLLIYAIPNGGHRHEWTRTHLKEEGLVKGMPDLHVPALNLWIEMKREHGGVVSQFQKDIIAHLNSIGHTACVCRGFEEAKAVFQKAYKKARKGVKK